MTTIPTRKELMIMLLLCLSHAFKTVLPECLVCALLAPAAMPYNVP